MIDISLTFDPIADIMEAMVVIILIKWIHFDKKQARKRGPRKKNDIVVQVPTVIMPENQVVE